jgi:hypothetical protein
MYELVELSSGNVVGMYADRDLALLMVLETVQRGGEQAAASLALGRDDSSGATDGELIARGADLVKMARDRWLAKAPHSAAVA